MTSREASAEQVEPTATEVAATDSAVPAATLGSPARAGAVVLALQQTAGNRAVLNLLNQRSPRRALQRRRVAGAGDLLDLVSNPAGPDFAVHLAATQRMIRSAWDERSDEDKNEVRKKRLHGLTEAQFNAMSAGDQSVWWAHAIRHVRPGLTETDPASVKAAWDELSSARKDEVRKLAMAKVTRAQFDALPPDERNARWAAAIRQVWPALALGDPLLIDTGPRPATADAANLQKLVDNANKVFDQIATGAETTNLTQVFGAAKVATARSKYAKARQRMNFLHTQRKIVADRSGYNFEVHLGGLTNSEQISLAPGKIDRPDDALSVVTMIHESMHAGNDDVDDKGYINIDPDTFKGLPTDVKLTNAAHFEVVPRRILGVEPSFAARPSPPRASGRRIVRRARRRSVAPPRRSGRRGRWGSTCTSCTSGSCARRRSGTRSSSRRASRASKPGSSSPTSCRSGPR